MNYRHPCTCSLFALLTLLACTAADAAQPVASFTRDVETRVVALTNDFRSKNGLQPVQPEARLTEAAQAFAAYIAKTDQLEHDADGSEPTDRAKKRGYNYCIIAENLASEYSSAGFTPERLAPNFVRGWSESASHRANMLEPEVTQIGVGIAAGPNSGEYYAVQMFGRPLSQMIKFRIANRTNTTIRYQYRKRSVTLAPREMRNHESCLSGEVRFELRGPQQAAAVRPKDGDRYSVVEAAGGVFSVKQE